MFYTWLKTKTAPLPIALSGLGLATTGIAVLYKNLTNPGLFTILAIFIAGFLFFTVLFKSLIHFSNLRLELRHPVTGSYYSTFTMGIMLWSTLINPYYSQFAFIVWIIGFAGHAFLLMLFISHRITQKDFKSVAPSWVIPVVGFGVTVLSGLEFIEAPWFLYILYLEYVLTSLVIMLILYYILFEGILKNPAIMPTFATFAAPINLLLLLSIAFYNTAEHAFIINFLAMVGLFSSILVYLSLIKLVQLKYAPIFTSYTFPLVIAASGSLRYSEYLKNNNLANAEFFYNIAIIQTTIATVLYALLFVALVAFIIKKVVVAK